MLILVTVARGGPSPGGPARVLAARLLASAWQRLRAATHTCNTGATTTNDDGDFNV